jgi:hypothetical protein
MCSIVLVCAALCRTVPQADCWHKASEQCVTPTSNIQHPTSNIQHPTSNIQHPTSNMRVWLKSIGKQAELF